MPPTPVSGAPRTSHDAADTPGIKSDHRSRSMRTSYTDAGIAVDGCSTRIDTEVGVTRKTTTDRRVAARICDRRQAIIEIDRPQDRGAGRRKRQLGWALCETVATK